MRSFIASAISLLAVGAVAAPADLSPRAASCMTGADAQQVAVNFKDLINLPFNTTLAKQAMTVGFTDYSDSVNELINSGCPNGPAPLGTATFSSRSAFIAGQSGQSPIPFHILKVWHNCDTVFMRWRSSEPAKGTPNEVFPEEKVTGIVVMETVPNTHGGEFAFKIATVYSEFNSGAWLYDLGVFTPSCSSSKRSIEARSFGVIA